MIQRWSAPLCLSAAAMLPYSGAKAGVWGVDPVLGITGDYATNPVLLDTPHTAQTDAALLIDAPTTYNGGDLKLSILPSFRIGDTRSYSSVNSDYEHLNVKGEFATERSAFTATAGVTRDSSLYLNYLANGAAGVRRDGAAADLNGARFLTENLELNADVDTTHVRYAGAAGVTALVDYKYTSVSPTLAWNSAERDKFTVTASAGQYDSLDGATRSRNANLQLGFARQVTEIWTLTASGGFSRALNRLVLDEYLVLTPQGIGISTVPVGEVLQVYPARAESSQNGAVYSVNLTRTGERLTLNAGASRQETPTGFAFLSRLETLELHAAYALTARWSLGANARYVNAQDPDQAQAGRLYGRTVKNFGLDATWQWTEHWTLSLAASRITERYESPHLDPASNQIAVTISRKFNHVGFQ